MRTAKMLAVLGTAIGLTGVTAAAAVAAAGTSASTATSAARAQASAQTPVGHAAADRTAVSYVIAHYRGPGTARVLATEPDTDHGQAVYDVRVLAPNDTTYEVHVSRASDTVLWADKAERQSSTQATADDRSSQAEGERSARHEESRDD